MNTTDLYTIVRQVPQISYSISSHSNHRKTSLARPARAHVSVVARGVAWGWRMLAAYNNKRVGTRMSCTSTSRTANKRYVPRFRWFSRHLRAPRCRRRRAEATRQTGPLLGRPARWRDLGKAQQQVRRVPCSRHSSGVSSATVYTCTRVPRAWPWATWHMPIWLLCGGAAPCTASPHKRLFQSSLVVGCVHIGGLADATAEHAGHVFSMHVHDTSRRVRAIVKQEDHRMRNIRRACNTPKQ